MATPRIIPNTENVPTVGISYAETTAMMPPSQVTVNGQSYWKSDYGRVVAFENYGERPGGNYNVYIKTRDGMVHTNCPEGLARAERENQEFERYRRSAHPPASMEPWIKEFQDYGNCQVLDQSMLTPKYGMTQTPETNQPHKKTLLEIAREKFGFYTTKEEPANTPKNNFTYRQTQIIGNAITRTGHEMNITGHMLEAMTALNKYDWGQQNLNATVTQTYANTPAFQQQLNNMLVENQIQPLTSNEWNYLLDQCQLTMKDIVHGPSVDVHDAQGQKLGSFGVVKHFSLDSNNDFVLSSSSGRTLDTTEKARSFDDGRCR